METRGAKKIQMKKWILTLLIFAGCTTRGTMMNRDSFADINIGESIEEVVAQYGEPYSIRSRGGDCDIYEYIERVLMGSEVIQQRRYYIVVTKGKVVGKYVKFYNPPAYDQIYTDDIYPNY